MFEGVCETMRINAGVNDAWFNPDTSGQGFFIIAWEPSQYMFVSWFTYDTARPPEGTPSMVGEPGHRWLTAQGPYTGDTATLDVYLSSGGVFDSAALTWSSVNVQASISLHDTHQSA